VTPILDRVSVSGVAVVVRNTTMGLTVAIFTAGLAMLVLVGEVATFATDVFAVMMTGAGSDTLGTAAFSLASKSVGPEAGAAAAIPDGLFVVIPVK
jgi:hypothetical protein